MKISNLTDYTVKREIDKFKKVVSTYMSGLMANFLPESSVESFTSQLDEYQYDSVIKSILETIFQYARGDIKLETKEQKWMLQQACDTICKIMWSSPAASKRFIINWTEWVKIPLGFAIKACYSRLKDTYTCEELGILLGYTRQEISRRAKLNLLPNKRIGGSYIFYKKDLIKTNILPEE